MSKGMNEEQKSRTREYLQNFKENNGGCIICRKPISDFYFTPAEDNSHIELRMYGSCYGHSMLSNSDQLLEQAVAELLPKLQETVDKPVLKIVSFNVDGEDLKYA